MNVDQYALLLTYIAVFLFGAVVGLAVLFVYFNISWRLERRRRGSTDEYWLARLQSPPLPQPDAIARFWGDIDRDWQGRPPLEPSPSDTVSALLRTLPRDSTSDYIARPYEEGD